VKIRSFVTALRRRRRPVRFGSFGGTAPVGAMWGYDRGTPVDRWYIERFLEQHRGDIRGRVLEVKDSGYSERFGRDIVEYGVIDIDPDNARASYVADVTTCAGIPSDRFDCLILTQTLQYVYDLGAAVDSIHRVLRPGGVVLVTVPVTSRLVPLPVTDYWRLTPLAAERLFVERFGGAAVVAKGRGNVLAQVAFLEGLAAEELRSRDLEVDDPEFPLLACVRAQKSLS
jgi:SAM-dependent methyltransferase